MKKLISVSLMLMVAAMLYGAVDFIKSSHSGELTNLYKEDPPVSNLVRLAWEENSAPIIKTNFVPGLTGKKPVKIEEAVFYRGSFSEHPQLSFSGFSRGALKQSDYRELPVANNKPETEVKKKNITVKKLKPVEIPVTSEKEKDNSLALSTSTNDMEPVMLPAVNVVEKRETPKPVKIKSNSKLSLDNFSRAPLKQDKFDLTAQADTKKKKK